MDLTQSWQYITLISWAVSLGSSSSDSIIPFLSVRIKRRWGRGEVSSLLKRKRVVAQDVTQNNNKLTTIEPYPQPTSNLTLPLQSPLPDLPWLLTLYNHLCRPALLLSCLSGLRGGEGEARLNAGSSSIKRKQVAAQDVTQNNNKLTTIEPYPQPTSNLTLPLQSPLPDLPWLLTLYNLEIQETETGS